MKDAAKAFAAFAAVGFGGALAWLRHDHREKQRHVQARCEYIETCRQAVIAGGLEVLGPENEAEAVRVMVASFKGTATTSPERFISGMLGPRFAEWDNQYRKAFFKWMMRSMWLHCTCPGGGIPIGVRSKSGALSAVCLAYPHVDAEGSHSKPCEAEPNPWADPIAKAAMQKVLAADFGTDKEGLEAEKLDSDVRFKALVSILSKLHPAYASGPHWYVQVMAVDPTQQGQGHSKTLFAAVHALADKIGVSCFLESAGARNKIVYEKAGYQAGGGQGWELNAPGVVDPPRDELDNNNITRVYGMVRPARSAL